MFFFCFVYVLIDAVCYIFHIWLYIFYLFVDVS